jgi:hypothetical protein
LLTIDHVARLSSVQMDFDIDQTIVSIPYGYPVYKRHHDRVWQDRIVSSEIIANLLDVGRYLVALKAPQRTIVIARNPFDIGECENVARGCGEGKDLVARSLFRLHGHVPKYRHWWARNVFFKCV